MIIDAFPFAGTPTELLLLECRLTELYDVVDHFIIVEGKVDHQDHPKNLNFLDNAMRYREWEDKITYVIADRLPTVAENDWEWAREHAQREYIRIGLDEIDAQPDDIVMQSDLDEIPRPIVVRNLRLQRNQIVAFHQRGHFWAVDWEFPLGWNGTTACRVGALDALFGKRPPFTAMRDTRNTAMQIPNAGWHTSWLGGPEAWQTKLNSFCHPWARELLGKKLDRCYREGIHDEGQGGIVMRPVDVDHTWPKWMQDRSNVPDSWYRPRD